MENTSFNLTPEEKEELIKFYEDKIESIQRELNQAKLRLSQLNDNVIIGKSDLLHRTKFHKPPDYDKWIVTKKISFALEYNKKCMTTKQIVTFLEQFETEKKKNFYGTISGTITTKVQRGILYNRYIPDGSVEFYVGLKEWFDEKGNVLEGYKAK